MRSEPAALVQRLAQALGAQLIETHISWVLLADTLAYKLKKPVQLPFVDYSDLERRRHFCEEELRLNRRLAPALYLDLARITGSAQAPAIDGGGPVLDYAVRMRRFPPGALFSERAEAGVLGAGEIDALAARLADFHLAAPVADEPVQDSSRLDARALAALHACTGLFEPAAAQALASWIQAQAAAVLPLWQARRAAGHARDGHGDLHLANVVLVDGEVAAFDCIEFDPALRRIDVVEDIAFTCMDLAAHGLPQLAWRLLDRWLERTGEYEGIAGLRLCLAYRALVRAMAHQLREAGGPKARLYAAQAQAWTRVEQVTLWITFGLPGSGKTYASQRLLQARGAIRIRSDVERKRLHGLAALADSRAQGQDLYTALATARTYARLFELAALLLRAGWPVVLDAAFLRADERLQARAVAQAAGARFAILECAAPPEVLRERLRSRRGDASEADVAVLEKLRAAAQPLDDEERAFVVAAP